MKKINFLLFFLFLTSCSNVHINGYIRCFSTGVDINLYEGNEDKVLEIKNIFSLYDKLCDNYLLRDINNVYTINNSSTEVTVSEDLYNLLKLSTSLNENDFSYFNPLCGSLAKKWKNAINNQQILAENIINEELDKINNTSISFLDNNVIKKEGEGEIDLGGIAKGYALDISLQYLEEQNIHHYLINAGMSSILLGEKQTSDGLFSVGLDQVNISNGYIRLKNCFVSTSAIYRQSEIIDGKVYSHIVNPYTGSVNAVNDAVIVVSDKGYIGDALSTSMMMNTLDEIKVIEQNQKVKTIVIRDNKIIYKNEGIEIYYH